MAIYGNLTQNTVDISVLENHLFAEIENFNKIIESINLLNEQGIVLEKVSIESIWVKIKTLLKKLKEIIDKFLKFMKESINKIKERSKNKIDNFLDKVESKQKFIKFDIDPKFFEIPDIIEKKYSECFILPVLEYVTINSVDELKNIIENGKDKQDKVDKIKESLFSEFNDYLKYKKIEVEESVRHYNNYLEETLNKINYSTTKAEKILQYSKQTREFYDKIQSDIQKGDKELFLNSMPISIFAEKDIKTGMEFISFTRKYMIILNEITLELCVNKYNS